jgi:5-methylcytosine-specific restriction enzyme subunit McrC
MECAGTGFLRLEPDILIERAERRLIMDTKWKLLAPGKRGRGGIADGDLYQLYAYARRYGSPRSVLLYPHVPGLEARNFDVLDATNARSGDRITIRHVHLHRNLYVEDERGKLVAELEEIVREGLDLPKTQHAPGHGDPV